MIDRHGDDFRDMIDQGLIDILFVNESELATLTGEDDFETGFAAVASKVPVLVATRSAKGAVAQAHGERADVAAVPIEKVVDSTGAGDQFAAGSYRVSRAASRLHAVLSAVQSLLPK